MNIFVIGSLSREDFIRKVAKHYELSGHNVMYVTKQPHKRLSDLIREAYMKISYADLIIAVKKEDGSLGTGTLYEIEFAKFLGKKIHILEEKLDG